MLHAEDDALPQPLALDGALPLAHADAVEVPQALALALPLSAALPVAVPEDVCEALPPGEPELEAQVLREKLPDGLAHAVGEPLVVGEALASCDAEPGGEGVPESDAEGVPLRLREAHALQLEECDGERLGGALREAHGDCELLKGGDTVG